MKKNWKFILSTVSIILSSALLLTGCIAAMTAGTDTPRPYERSTVPQAVADAGSNPDEETSDQHFFIVESQIDPDLTATPVSQEELKEKFSAMYDFSNGDNTISVISEVHLLQNFWGSGNEKEVARSLSIAEVLYIIQDSIRIYNEYDTVILEGISADAINASDGIRYPDLEQQSIDPNPDDRDQAREDVRKIIQYRLQALSSPEAFFTVAEMMEYRNIDLASVPEICQEVFFYIPNYSADINRDLYLSDANYSNSRSKFGVFCFSYFNRIVLFSCSNPETVFPTKELSLKVQENEVIYLEMSPDWLMKPEYYDTLLGIRSFIFNPEEQTFYIATTGARFDSAKNCVELEKDCHDFKKWPGTYKETGNRLSLYPFDIPDAVYVFDYGADGSLIFNAAQSHQFELHFEDQSIYQPIDPNP